MIEILIPIEVVSQGPPELHDTKESDSNSNPAQCHQPQEKLPLIATWNMCWAMPKSSIQFPAPQYFAKSSFAYPTYMTAKNEFPMSLGCHLAIVGICAVQMQSKCGHRTGIQEIEVDMCVEGTLIVRQQPSQLFKVRSD